MSYQFTIPCPSQIGRLPGPDDGRDAHLGEGQLQFPQPPPRGRGLLPPHLREDLLLLRGLHVVLAVPDEDEVPRGRGGGGGLGVPGGLALLSLAPSRHLRVLAAVPVVDPLGLFPRELSCPRLLPDCHPFLSKPPTFNSYALNHFELLCSEVLSITELKYEILSVRYMIN